MCSTHLRGSSYLHWSHRVGKASLLLWIMAFHVVLNLNLRPCLPWSAFRFDDVVHKPAIASLFDLVVEDKFKGCVLVLGDNVARVFGDSLWLRRQLANRLTGPVCRTAPLIDIHAIEQKDPSGVFFFGVRELREPVNIPRNRLRSILKLRASVVVSNVSCMLDREWM